MVERANHRLPEETADDRAAEILASTGADQNGIFGVTVPGAADPGFKKPR